MTNADPAELITNEDLKKKLFEVHPEAVVLHDEPDQGLVASIAGQVFMVTKMGCAEIVESKRSKALTKLMGLPNMTDAIEKPVNN